MATHYKFQLTAGLHRDRANGQTHYKGDVFTHPDNLAKKYNTPGPGGEKFKLLGTVEVSEAEAAAIAETPPPKPVEKPPVDLDRLTIHQLRELAVEKEIDLSGAKTKDEIQYRILEYYESLNQ